MIQFQAGGYARQCDPNSGGVAAVWVADSSDFDWTNAGGTNTCVYSAVGLRGGATILDGSGFFPIGFDIYEGELKTGHSVKGSSNKYGNSLMVQLPVWGKEAGIFAAKMQKASACGSLLFVVQQNNGRIMVMGESYVNGIKIPPFRVIMDGTEFESGKQFDDINGAKFMFKGDYTRPLFEFTGGVDAIIALEGTM